MQVKTSAGSVIDLGTTETAPTIGIVDYSKRVVDAFGVTRVVERAFSRRMSVRLALPFDGVDAVRSKLEELRASSAQWIADDRFAWLKVQGFYKDFDLELQTSSVSFCRLTVEGIASFETVADSGSDPAPPGQGSTFRLLQPFTKPSLLVSSTVAEGDYPEWSSTATYGAGQRVIKAATHRIYESVAAGNVGKDPASTVGQWTDVGPTNRWAMLDQALGTATIAANSITVVLAPETANAVALLDVVADSVQVQTSSFSRTVAVVGGSASVLDLPQTTGQVTVKITGSGQVSVGTLLIGKLVTLGVTEAAPSAGIIDYSRKAVDEFGTATIVDRAAAKRMAAKALLRTDAIDQVANRIAAVRAKPCLWVGQSGIDTLTIYGFCKEWSIEVGEGVSKLSLSVEGLSKAPVSIEGVTKQELVDRAVAAQMAAAQALQAIATIASDVILSAGEKPQVIREWLGIAGERPSIIAQADALQVARTGYDAAYQALASYLSSLSPQWSDTAVDTPIVAAEFNGKFSSYYSARSALLMALADKSANNSALSDGNRVRYSQFEAGTFGYGVLYNTAGVGGSQGVNQPLGAGTKTFFYGYQPWGTGPGQTFSIGTTGGGRPALMIPCRPNERVFGGFEQLVDGGGAAGVGTLGQIGFLDANGAPIPGWQLNLEYRLIDGKQMWGGLFTTPPTGYGIWFELRAFNNNSGASYTTIWMADCMVTSAGALQTQWPPFTPGPSGEYGADVTLIPNGTDHTFRYDANGVIIPGQGRNVTFTLDGPSGPVTSGVIWTIKVVSGGWNGDGPGPTEYPMAGNGAGSTFIGSVESTAVAEIKAVRNGRPYVMRRTFYREQAAPTVISGGGGSGGGGGGTGGTSTPTGTLLAQKNSGWLATSQASYTEIGRIDLTAPSTGSISTPAGITFTPAEPSGPSYSRTYGVAMKWQRETTLDANIWEDISAVASGNTYARRYNNGTAQEPDYVTDISSVTLQANGSKAGLPAGSAQRLRLVAAIAPAGSTITPTHYPDGTGSALAA